MTTLAKDQAAIISNKNDGLDVYLPGKLEEVPNHMAYMVACAMRYHNDPAFVASMLAWLEAAMPRTVQ